MSIQLVVRHAALTTALIAAITHPAPAQSINIDIDGAIGSGAGVPASSWGAAAGQSGVWNSVVFQPSNPGPFLLADTSGAATGVTIRHTGATGTLNFTQNATSGNTKLLMDDAVFAATPYTITITGLAPGAYSITTYANAPSGSGGFERNSIVIAGATSPNPQSIGGPVIAGQPLVNGMTHATHAITIAAGQNLTINANPFNGGNAYINGIQIVKALAPLADIASPAEGSCVCGNVAVFGTAANLTGYTLDVASSDAGPWTTIASQSGGTVGGVIGIWNTATAATGEYILRLRVNGPLQQQTSFSRRVFVDRTPPVITLDTPGASEILGGVVRIAGDAGDRCLTGVQVGYAVSTAGPYLPIDMSQSTLIPAAGAIAIWDTINAGVADANYFLRLFAADSCTPGAQIVRPITIDNAPPLVALHTPAPREAVCGQIAINATISDAHLAGWSLYYSSDADSGWTPIAAGTNNAQGHIANWNTSGIPGGPYTLRLIARDRATIDAIPFAGNVTEVTRSIFVGMAGDLNQDGGVDNADLGVILAQFGMRCN